MISHEIIIILQSFTIGILILEKLLKYFNTQTWGNENGSKFLLFNKRSGKAIEENGISFRDNLIANGWNKIEPWYAFWK